MVSQEIADQLAQRIEKGEIALGSFLPPTRQLATTFNVSQHTIGIVLKRLEGLRLVQCLPRQGAKVRARTPLEGANPQVKQIAVFVISERDWLTESHGSWGWRIFHAFEEELFNAGYSMLPISASQPLVSEGITLESRLDRLGPTLCGALYFASPDALRIAELLDKRNVPAVAVGRPSRDVRHNYVTARHMEGGRKVGRLFAACEFKQILLLYGAPNPRISDSDKMTGVFQGYLESGGATEGIKPIACGGIAEMDGYRTTRALLDQGYRPHAIFATGDYLAAGAIHALHDAGIRVPEEVSVIGATGLDASAGMDPPLSVLAQPVEQLGKAAAHMLRHMMAEQTRRQAARAFDCPLILRASTNIPQELTNQLAGEAGKEFVSEES